MDYVELGKKWLSGEVIIKEFNGIKLNPKQAEFVNSKERSVLFGGGMSSGKTLAFIVKFILLSQFFPGATFLIGRKTQGNAEDSFMKDFRELCPMGMYEHQKGYHKIKFSNGSEAEFWGLDALQSGSSTDIKKAEQKLKTHNFTFIFTDQLEEIERKVFDALQSRMRRRSCKHSKEVMEVHRDGNGNAVYEVCKECGKYTFNQYCATTNPANFWAYDYFKANPRPNTKLVETSTLDNKAHLTDQFIESELEKPELYKRRFFYGEWSPDSMVEGGVFHEEWIKNQDALVQEPIRVWGGIRIFEEPDFHDYQIGIDPSLGASDPCNISCISKKSGRMVATYTAFVPTNVIVEKALQIANLYSLQSKPLIVPEATGIGQALVEALRPVYDNIFIREVYAGIGEKKLKKLGFYTTHATKSQLIENMKELFQKGFPKILDKDTVNELKTFIYTDSALEKGAGAQEGYHDDRVMGALLAYYNVPFNVEAVEKEIKEFKNLFETKRNRAYLNSTK